MCRSISDESYTDLRSKFKAISLLEIFNMKDCLNDSFEGTITIRTNFTGWNIEALIKEKNYESD